MGISAMDGPTDQAESLATIHAALGARRKDVLLSVKFGALRRSSATGVAVGPGDSG
jgi:hypothetical protein